MSYRRGRSYRRAARLYRNHEERPPRARPALMMGLLALVLGVGMAAVITPHIRTVLARLGQRGGSGESLPHSCFGRIGHVRRVGRVSCRSRGRVGRR